MEIFTITPLLKIVNVMMDISLMDLFVKPVDSSVKLAKTLMFVLLVKLIHLQELVKCAVVPPIITQIPKLI